MIPYFRIDYFEKDAAMKGLKIRCSKGTQEPVFPRDFIHCPSGKAVRLQPLDEPAGDWYSLRGMAKKYLRVGDLILPADWDCREASEAYFYNPERSFEQAESELSADPLGKDAQKLCKYKCYDHMVKIRFTGKLWLVPGLNYQIKGLKQPLMLLHPGPLDKGQQAFVQKAMSDWRPQSDLFRQISALRLALFKLTVSPLEMEDLTMAHCKRVGHWLVNEKFWEIKLQAFQKQISSMGGVAADKLEREFHPLFDPLFKELQDQGIAERKKGFIMRADRSPKDNLSPFAASLLAKLELKQAGISPSTLNPSELEQYRMMARMGLLHFSEDWICPEAYYLEKSAEIGDLLKKQPGQDMAELKNITGMSRRETLNILNWMEEKGEIINQDNKRYLT